MKRTLIALAVLATASSAALAQSSVTVYGRLNTSIERQDNIGAEGKRTVMQNNSSRLGFKGTEDLGGGLKGLFLLEHRFASDTGVAAEEFWAGDAYIGVQSASLGTVRLGRITSPAYYATADYVSLHNHDTGTSSDAFYVGTTYNQAPKNTVTYLTPSFGGLTAEVGYSFGEGDDQAKTAQFAINYDAGPLHLGLGYDRAKDPVDVSGAVGVADVGVKDQVAVRALYELGAFTIGGYYQRAKFEELGGGDTVTRDSIRLAGMYTVGASEFHANVGWADDVEDANDTGAIQYTLGYNYNLSKRTKVYAFYTKVDNDDNIGYLSGAAGENASSIAIGVRHNF